MVGAGCQLNLGLQTCGEMADLGTGRQDEDGERGWSEPGVFFPLPSGRGTLEWEVAQPEAPCKEHSPLSQALCSKALSPCYVRGYSAWALQPSLLQPGSHFEPIKAVCF